MLIYHLRHFSFPCNTSREDLEPVNPLLEEQKIVKTAVEKKQPVTMRLGFTLNVLFFHTKVGKI